MYIGDDVADSAEVRVGNIAHEVSPSLMEYSARMPAGHLFTAND